MYSFALTVEKHVASATRRAVTSKNFLSAADHVRVASVPAKNVDGVNPTDAALVALIEKYRVSL